ncbi:MOSC domain-containing protein [Motiliproteus coralliicola]|uniref:MOSC domain-containing protein n=1 Tax=Motiliproteus coralliicola TaxID=2283196 RepID=A0A369WCK1_9GAMM|nr:hybrid-cluster NAD(P)-dependent oxidoreductase [Motiliproteus coralliicola]RDE19760.1 MOSC domain-containing protein [Motiliproteus coralliicola]
MSNPCVSQISVYPIKSTTGIHLNHAYMEERGLAFDRRFVVARPDGSFVTARTHSRLLLVHSALGADGLHLRAPEMEPITLNYRDFVDDYRPLEIWGQSMQGQSCGDAAADWFSRLLEEPVQLLYCGEQTQRPRKEGFDGVPDGQVSFADASPLLLISEASLEDLNSRVGRELPMTRFRPNLVAKGCEAFAEDSWKRIRIGEVEFVATDGCSRCVLTSIDPQTAQPDADNEPLVTLSRYRKGEDRKVYFGQNFVAANPGKITLYDPIEVLETVEPPHYPDNAPPKPKPAVRPHRWRSNELAELHCVHLRDETADVRTFTFELAGKLQPDYQPGQFICLELEVDGEPVHRNYTLSSSPSRPERLSITVKRVEGGRISNWLHDNLKLGDSIHARAPAGDFHCFAAPQDKILLLSAGSGITPMLSMLRWMTDLQLDNDIVFFHSAHTEADLIARQELELLAAQHGRCELVYTLTQAKPGDLRSFRGRLDRSMLEAVSKLSERQAYVCGPHPFMARAKELLLALGLPETHYFEESFGVREFDDSSDAKPDQPVKILFDSWDSFVEGDTHSTLLEQAEKAGVAIPFSCRGGFCGSCRVKLESGEVEVLQDAGLSEQDKEQGYVLACSCRPKGDLVVTQG